MQHALCAVAMILNQKGLLVLVLVGRRGGVHYSFGLPAFQAPTKARVMIAEFLATSSFACCLQQH
jgi:hypothetical protein